MCAQTEPLPRVLVVDDDAAIARMITITLRSSGYQVETAVNGVAGLEQLEANEPDVIVLDLKMPVMDGRTFYREMRRRGVSTPVVLLSAHGAKDAQRELDAEAAITKPFRPEELTEAIDELLSARP